MTTLWVNLINGWNVRTNMQNFTKEESSALLYLKLAKDLGANNISINKSTCEVIINLVERLMQKSNGGY